MRKDPVLVATNQRAYGELRRFAKAFFCGVLGFAVGYYGNAHNLKWLELVADGIVVGAVCLCFIFLIRGFLLSSKGD
jgi:hypothetical protein